MCGLVAYIANRKHGFNNGEVKAFKEMLHINSLRGSDSTGVFYVTNRGDVQTHKEVGDSPSFLKTKEWDATDKELFRNGQAIVGHCRASTRGAKTDANAHPFVVDNRIVLVHNGTYMGDHKHLADTEVDSHAIAHVLAEEKDIASALRKVNAAYALIWYNTDTKKLYAVRNKHRPLFMAMLEDGSMMIASEIGFIYTAAWRNELKINKEFPVMLPENQLFSCDLSDITQPYEWEDINCEYVYVKKEEPKKEPVKTVPLVLLPPTKASKEQSVWGTASLTETAERLGIGKHTCRTHGETLYELLAPGAEVIVEAMDYVCVDETAGVYHVFGKIVSIDEKLSGMIAGWEITAEYEMEVVEYTSDRFYKCVLEYQLSRGPVSKPGSIQTIVWKMKSAVRAESVTVDSMEMNYD